MFKIHKQRGEKAQQLISRNKLPHCLSGSEKSTHLESSRSISKFNTYKLQSFFFFFASSTASLSIVNLRLRTKSLRPNNVFPFRNHPRLSPGFANSPPNKERLAYLLLAHQIKASLVLSRLQLAINLLSKHVCISSSRVRKKLVIHKTHSPTKSHLRLITTPPLFLPTPWTGSLGMFLLKEPHWSVLQLALFTY